LTLTVSTTSGHIHGKIDPSLPNARQFLGIPYAVPALGSLRFALPQKLYQPNAQIEATKLPPSCMQYQSTDTNSFGKQDVLQFFSAGLMGQSNSKPHCSVIQLPFEHLWLPNAPGHEQSNVLMFDHRAVVE
jgi:hypothetical protein